MIRFCCAAFAARMTLFGVCVIDGFAINEDSILIAILFALRAALYEREISNIFKKYIVGAATAIFLEVMSFAYYLFPASIEVSVWVLFCLAIISFSTCLSFCAYFRSKYECVESDHLVKVRTLFQKDNDLIAIADRSVLLKQDIIVQLCLKEHGEEYEAVIGWGYVQTINSKGFPQIVMSKGISGSSFNLEELQKRPA